MNEKHKLNDKFEPKEFEDRLYRDWETKGYFKPSDDKTKEPIGKTKRATNKSRCA